jgi:hypothetical protein
MGIFTAKHPCKRYSYAVTAGTYIGEILVFIEQNEENYCFISIPKNKNRIVPKDKFHLGIAEDIVEIVEKLPNNIFKLLEKQYHYNTKTAK